jgi:UDP-GlcNAc3NAcA epimerase
MRIVSIVGARPQFVKLAVICRALARHEDWIHRIVHTGQHYDAGLSGVFFEELMIPRPDHHLGVGSGAHGEQTGEMLKRLEPVLAAERPDWVLLYGDTNSTLAGAVVASKLVLPTAHIEAGLRSYRRGMPEEINRIVADHLSDLLFCPTTCAMENLRSEGLSERALRTGDVMYDAALLYRQAAERRGGPLGDTWRPGEFALATVHRAENTDDPDRLRDIAGALDEIAKTICPVVWPVHPRTAKRLSEMGCSTGAISTIDPVPYFDMLLLESRARFVLTDSGGVQKEAYFFRVPCITLRDETEWVETLENRCNSLAGPCKQKILQATLGIGTAGPWTAVYGDGSAGEAIANALGEGSSRWSAPHAKSQNAEKWAR